MKRSRRDAWAAVGFLVFAGLVYHQTVTTFVTMGATSGGPFADSAFYPRAIVYTIVFLSTILLLSSLFRREKAQAQTSPEISVVASGRASDQDEEPTVISVVQGNVQETTLSLQRGLTTSQVASVAVLLLGYTFALDWLGYLVATPVFMAAFFVLLRIRRWTVVLVMSLASTVLFYVFFVVILNVILPRGRLGLF